MKKKYIYEFLLSLTAMILLAVISNRLYFRVDTTEQKLYTLSDYTENMIAGLDSTVQITWFKSENVFSFFPSLKYLEDMLNEYSLYGDAKILIAEKNTGELSDEAIQQLGIVPRQIQSKNINSQTVYSIYSALMIEYKGETRIIPFIDDIDILEYDIARFIEDINLTINNQANKKTIALIAPPNSLEGDYRFVLPWLDYAGFNVLPLKLPIQNIPANIPLMVIGSDYLDFSSATAIDIFLEKQGSAVFFVSGNTVNYKGDWKAKAKLDDYLLPVLARQGFSINSDLVMDLINFRIEMSAQNNSGSKFVNYPFWLQILPATIKKDNPLFSAYKNLQCFWPSSLSLEENLTRPLASTTKKAVSMIDNYDTDPFGKQLSFFGGDNAGERIIIAENKSDKNKNRILVISDEYMISNAIDFTGTSYNMDFMVNCVEYIFAKDALISLKNKQHTAKPFKKFEDNNEFTSIVFKSRLFNLIILPLCILAFGIYIFISNRKGK